MPRHLCLVPWSGALAFALAACSADDGASNDPALADVADGALLDDAHADSAKTEAGAKDASTGNDSGSSSSGWTPEVDIFSTFLTSLSGTRIESDTLLADPVSPRTLLFRFEAFANMPLAAIWTNGTFSSPLALQSSTNTNQSITWIGGGLDGAGNAYLYYVVTGGANQTPFSMVSYAKGQWTWWPMPQPFVYPRWPPTSIALASAASNTREYLYADSDIFDVTGKLYPSMYAQWPDYPIQSATPTLSSFTDVAFVPGQPQSFLTISGNAIRACTIGSPIQCSTTTAAGFASDDSLTRLAFAGGNANVVTAVSAVTSPAGRLSRLYISKDGGGSFSRVPLPAWPIPIGGYAVSPKDADTIAVYLPPYSNVADELITTKDGGATWTNLALPNTATTDVDGFVFDAAGTFFLTRAGQLFSRVL